MRMIRHIFSILFTAVFFMNCAIGQTETATSKKIADQFEMNYNAGRFDSIFSSFSAEMQAAFPLDKISEFLSGLKLQAGKITAKQYTGYDKSYARYKTTFEKSSFTVNISADNNARINGLFLEPVNENIVATSLRNSTKLILPFDGEWTVIWGGDKKELNHHIGSEAQKNAFDILITDEKGKSYKTDGKTNEDHYAFGKELKAPCDGEVVLVVDGIKDNKPGVSNPVYIPGNTVILKTTNNEFLFFAHFKQHSIKVRQGQRVEQGQVLGLCGNSGNSTEPHLHFHIQDTEDMNTATGVKCYFENIKVNGQIKEDYSPIQKEKIRN